MRCIAMVCLIGLWGGAVAAHSPLDTTIPADGAIVDTVPLDVALTFKKSIRLTRVSAAHDGAAAVDLDLSEQTDFVTDFVLPFQGADSGTYRIDWRGLSDDGHIVNGSFAFDVE